MSRLTAFITLALAALMTVLTGLCRDLRVVYNTGRLYWYTLLGLNFMLRFAVISALLMVLLAACGGGEDDPEGFTRATATFEPGASTVDILFPQNGTVIYAEAVTVSGRLVGQPQQFTVQVVDLDENILVESTLDEQPGDWLVEMIHGYSGDPSELEIRAISAGEAAEIFDRANVLISDVSNRPAGAFGTVVLPAAGDMLGGDMIPVEGRASGATENTLTVELVREDGRMVDTRIVTLNNPYLIDEVPWQVELDRREADGPATLTVYTDDPSGEGRIELAVIEVELAEAAG